MLGQINNLCALVNCYKSLLTEHIKWAVHFVVEEAFAVAPATLIGFTDMFLPALLITGVASVKTKFIIGVLSLVQIIYLTEVGVIVIKSEVPLGIGKLFILFLERTVLAIPMIVLFANLVL